MLFQPFGIQFLGETMVILGGSLTQVAFPAIFVGYFARAGNTRRDLHAATVCLWWTAMNMLAVAVYAADARAGVLMLVNGQTGHESDGHDWHNLFARWGMLRSDTVIAGGMRDLAWLLFAASIVGGLYFVWRAAEPANEIHSQMDADRAA
jgi:hypothetical protein